MEKIQPLTEEQSKKIEMVIIREYDRVIKATSLLKLLRVYNRQSSNDIALLIDSVELEYVTEIILELLTPVQNLLSEVGGGAWYLLDERA